MIPIGVGVVILIAVSLFVKNIAQTETKSPTQSSTTHSTPYPSASPSDSWQYPSSHLVEEDNRQTTWGSADSPEQITKWYENKIKFLEMSAKSFVKTTANGKVENKLAAANGPYKIKIEITKSPTTSSTLITIDK